MTVSQRYGSVKRLGVRYGRTVRQKVGKIEQELRSAHKCPYCHRPKVKRQASGIWLCNKCGSRFTSRAYTVSKFPNIKEAEETVV